MINNNTTFSELGIENLVVEKPEQIFTESLYQQENRKQLEILEARYRYAYKFVTVAQKINDSHVFRIQLTSLFQVLDSLSVLGAF